ncbi:PI-PLC X domain-containing protein At5g67130 isoform X1 [Brachypodium distachyon]|uniref:PI-PLC X domain-containing protein At5g67130 isoform X1 n=1 Tax=Brachypodium distachyon TaxID=15368 RepID=UPI00052FF92F|nr:PI-PLC X domain-containing protein At5g67130 isoform X1 [Brachypodium distachyon]XP_010238024.1 PI-PLC X domain-containing protein At5g67130 isoform X1 [Brachypodium distachyon]XP_010238026.1 PI-PLC X domain-containing protein At5g67130 isoform X1 [Brachypodium distachyon]XP_014757393.1 PI-PLC X domain-containing protein At5g67130 isoform X1 [Brachypodium distachyon]XP_014757394.1 PI-PLC X domain-containing protein At5g67130 isoform X1 [Brachypodium distachyon]XP_024310482.1 PI-PLC X domain|eukprot:XP_010238023.1 PI-PLC X domain-containing protein At5g67130 isoform X1 [Brachypodium distachyon]
MGGIFTVAAALVLLVAGLVGTAIANVGDDCSTSADCGAGQWCFDCEPELSGSHCVRSVGTNPFQLVNNSLPFNKYAYLTTHNAFAIVGEPSHTGIPRITFDNQEDTVTDQLNNGVRALMLDTYDFKGDVWLCHSSGGKCNDFTAFEPALDTFNEIQAFLSANPSEIVTLILEDYVSAPNGLTNVFKSSGLQKYWFPVSKMPSNSQDWPLVSDMVASNQRLLVFTSVRSKQATEGIAYQWNFMVENNCEAPPFLQTKTLFTSSSSSVSSVCIWKLHVSFVADGDAGMDAGQCSNRAESAPLADKTKSLVLMNYFPSVPLKLTACLQHSKGLTDMVNTCYSASGNRWANFLAVDYYKRSEGGGVFQDMDLLNGKLLCGCQDVQACPKGSSVVCSA